MGYGSIYALRPLSENVNTIIRQGLHFFQNFAEGNGAEMEKRDMRHQEEESSWEEHQVLFWV